MSEGERLVEFFIIARGHFETAAGRLGISVLCSVR